MLQQWLIACVLFKGKNIKDPRAAGKQTDDKTKQNNDGHPSESIPLSTTALMEMAGDVTDASTSNQPLTKDRARENLPPGYRTESSSVSLEEADRANSSIAFSAANIDTRMKFVSSGLDTSLREQFNQATSEDQDKDLPDSYKLAQESETWLRETGTDSGSAQFAACDEAHQAESKEMAKENEDPGTDSLLDTSQEKSFSEEPATDSSCSATQPPGQAHADREKQRPSGKRRKKKRHSKSYSGSLFHI